MKSGHTSFEEPGPFKPASHRTSIDSVVSATSPTCSKPEYYGTSSDKRMQALYIQQIFLQKNIFKF